MLESEIRLTSLGCGSPSRDPTLSRLEESYGFPDAPAPRYVLPRASTGPELVAAVMMVEGHLKAADLGVNLGTHLTDALFWLREPESRLRQRLVGGGPGDPFAPKIAEAMLQGGRTAAEALGHIGDLGAALGKIEATPCPCCGREFRGE
jgi:hypothetical protein